MFSLSCLCGARPNDKDKESAGNRNREQNRQGPQICEDKREEEGRLGRRQNKEELREDTTSSSNSNSKVVHACTHGNRSKN